MKKLLILALILFLGCSTEPETVHGCLDSEACNYNSSATIDNNSCAYLTEFCDCDGNRLTEYFNCDGNYCNEGYACEE